LTATQVRRRILGRDFLLLGRRTSAHVREEERSMTELRRTIYGVAIVVAVTLAAQFVGWVRQEPPPPPKTMEMEARFIFIEGRVQVKRAGTPQWIDATLVVTLRKHDLVHTGDKARAEIRFADGTQVSVRPDSLISIPGLDSEGHPLFGPEHELGNPSAAEPGESGVRIFKGQGRADSGGGKPKSKSNSAK
jgi:hypothetical protein